jgi:Arc/MetJ family transcription regulator
MRKTLNIDAELLAKARTMSHAKTDTEAIHLGLRLLVSHIAAQKNETVRGIGTECRRFATSPLFRIRSRWRMPVLVDASGWVRFPQGREPFASEVDR